MASRGSALARALGEAQSSPPPPSSKKKRKAPSDAELRRQVQREKRRPIKVDTGDILKSRTRTTKVGDRTVVESAAGVGARARGNVRKASLQEKVAKVGLDAVGAAPSYDEVVDLFLEHGRAPAPGIEVYGVPGAKGAIDRKAKDGEKGGALLAAVSPPKIKDAGLLGRAIADAINFPKNAVVGTYELGASLSEALQKHVPVTEGVLPGKGSTERGNKLAKNFADHTVLGQLLVHGDPDAALKAADEHPLYAALDVSLAGQIVGRGAGAVARTGVAGPGVKAAASTRRDPLRVEGTNQTVERRYSPNVIVKSGQVAGERLARRQGHDPNIARGKQRERVLNRNVDEFAAQAESVRRRGREEVVKEAGRMAPVRRGAGAGGRAGRAAAAIDRSRAAAAESSSLPVRKGRPERDVVLAAVEGRLRGPATFREDLLRERTRLDDVFQADRARPKEQREMTAPVRQANREQVKALDRVLNDPRALANAPEVFRAADEYAAHAKKIEDDLIAQKALDPEQATAARVRTYGVAVMGLKPSTKPRAPAHLEQRHAQAGAVAQAKRTVLEDARRAESKAVARRHRLMGVQASARSRRRAAGRPAAATLAERRRLAEATDSVKAAAAARRAAEGEFRAARKTHADAKPKKTIGGLVDDQGRLVSTAEIVQHIRANGNREPGFVGHRRDQRGAASYFVNWAGGRKTVDGKRRSGEAARTGAYDASYRALEEQLVRGQGVRDAIGTFDEFIGRFGSKRRDGRPYTWAEAERAAGELAEATGMEWTPVRAVPARYDAASREAILDTQGTASTPGHLDSLTLGRLDDAMRPPEGASAGARNVVLVPAQQAERFRQHQTTGTSTAGKAGQVYTRTFRGAVLPFSTKWITGNVAEAVLRSGAHGVTPLDVLRGARVMRELRKLDRQAWRQADARLRGGLLFGAGDKLNVRRASEDFAGTALHTPAQVAEFVGRLPVVRQTLGGLRMYQRAIFALNRGFERAAQTGVIGKVARKEAQELTGSWAKGVRMQEQVAREVARGLLGTPKQVQFARYVDEVLGKYSRFSPSTRRVIQTFAPFLPWFLNAARFVGHTLPVKHPAKTALLTNVEVALQEEIEASREGLPPGSLESAVRLKDGGLLDLARYTPFGAFTGGPEELAAPLLPQIDSVVAALRGQSFTGRPLRLESGERATSSQRLWLALNALVEGSAPGVSILRRAQEGGGTGFDDSTVFSPKVKPGTKRGGAADRILNPLRPTYLGGGGSGAAKAPAGSALEREARAILEQQRSPAAARQQEALEREARAILAEQKRVRP